MRYWLSLICLILFASSAMAKELVITRDNTPEWSFDRPIWAELVLGEVVAHNRAVANLMAHYKTQPLLKALSDEESAALGHGMVWWDFRALPKYPLNNSHGLYFEANFRATEDDLTLKSGMMLNKRLSWLLELRERLKEQQKELEDAKAGQFVKMAQATDRLYNLLGQINVNSPMTPAPFKDGLEALLNKQSEARQAQIRAIEDEVDPLAQLNKQRAFFEAELKRREELLAHNTHLFPVKDDEAGLLAQAERLKAEFNFFLGSIRIYEAQLNRERARAFEEVRRELKAKQPEPPDREKYPAPEAYAKAQEEFRSAIRASLKELEVTKRQNQALEALKEAEARVWLGEMATQVLKPRLEALSKLKNQRVTVEDKDLRFVVKGLDKEELGVRFGYKGANWDQTFPSQTMLNKDDFTVAGLWRLASPDEKRMYFTFAGVTLTHKPDSKTRSYELTDPLPFSEEAVYEKYAIADTDKARIETKNLNYAHRMQDKLWDKELGMEFVLVDGGCYQMGCSPKQRRDADGNLYSANECEENSQPAHEVCLDSFLLAKFEITQKIWEQVMGSQPSKFAKGPDFPVESVTLTDVRAFLSKLKSQGKNYRLPTEAEWEFSCRSGKQMDYGTSSGAANHDQANFEYTGGRDRWGETAPVGSFPPNLLGLYDMSGNVWEWVEDGYDANYYASSPKNNPLNQQSGANVLRGGSWLSHSSNLSCYKRVINAPEYTNFTVGFRVVREDAEGNKPEAAPAAKSK
ncbi:MAG: hypothetical protein A2508_01870 [Candidatus Lambdaproteobacteria bacterium RIFOXYD12_FULL_49_8]|uniref:Sulfatase-modifying factor enzyme-like domain-containing protein n=1 Tax=Candidatus Lambdaproteobacteria bacterium RIFOXYD2_FULL_50_16 TaxID=1817772 RepID=A0A1F6G9Z4_9PROT|nr:MAG: hypothetical protein A2527_06220 [Candidatus Lambdaproteobacteria bacterium RIFOXYD2_FULL_50_16]OGG98218.1 MAG: hypothetical protein A2508_01870 [Candidatus Lambdaproteobacteria bacterium RIFOXYD12_FULL_49_8]